MKSKVEKESIFIKLSKQEMKLIMGGNSELEDVGDGTPGCIERTKTCKKAGECCAPYECAGCPDTGYACI